MGELISAYGSDINCTFMTYKVKLQFTQKKNLYDKWPKALNANLITNCDLYIKTYTSESLQEYAQ